MPDKQRSFKFTVKALDALQPPESGRVDYHDSECRGLILTVTATGTKTFGRYGRVAGKPKRIRIGEYPRYTIAVARKACEKLTGEIAIGRDPQAERIVVRRQKTLQELWNHYRVACSEGDRSHPGWQPIKRTWRRDVSQWERVLSDWAHRRLNDIKRTHIIERERELSRKSGPGAGVKFVELIKAMFNEAIDNEWCEHNPAVRIKLKRAEERERFISDDEMHGFAEAVNGLKTKRARDFIWLCLFTAARRSNVCAMEWNEIDFEKSLWTIPKSKFKGKRDMQVALPTAAIEILQSRRADATEDTRFVFPGNRSKSGHYEEPKDAWNRVKTASGLHDIRPHDLRRTLASWQAERGVSLLTIGKSLGHKKASVTGIYARQGLKPVRKAVEEASAAINEFKIATEQKKP